MREECGELLWHDTLDSDGEKLTPGLVQDHVEKHACAVHKVQVARLR